MQDRKMAKREMIFHFPVHYFVSSGSGDEQGAYMNSDTDFVGAVLSNHHKMLG